MRAAKKPTAIEKREENAKALAPFSLHNLRQKLPLVLSGDLNLPPSPKPRYRSAYRYLGADDLTEGMDPCSEKWGDSGMAMTVKGQSIPAYDPRGMQGMGIGYATSNRGACHLRGCTPAAEVVNWVLGDEVEADPLAWEGKAELQIIFQNVYGFTDSLDVCKFGTFAIPLTVYAALYSGMTGVPLDPDGLLQIGERVYNLERYYNNQAGHGEGSDYLPERFLKETGAGAASDSVCELDKMLEEFYALRGWENGLVTEAKLIELGIIQQFQHICGSQSGWPFKDGQPLCCVWLRGRPARVPILRLRRGRGRAGHPFRGC